MTLKTTSAADRVNLNLVRAKGAPVPVRWQIDIPREHDVYLEALMKKLGISQKKDLFNNAVTLLDWAVGELEKGRKIASVDEATEKYRELTMPIFKKIPRLR